MIAHAGKVLDTTTTNQYDRVLLQVVTFAADVACDLESVSQTHTAGLRRGEYKFRIEPSGETWAASGYRTVIVGEGQPNEVGFELVKSCVRELKVVTADSEPVAGTKFELLEAVEGTPIELGTRVDRSGGMSMGNRVHPIVLYEGATGGDGGIELRGPVGRALGLRILGPGHLPKVVRDVVLDSGTGPIVVTVSRGATIVGRIRPVKILEQMREMAAGNRRARALGPGLSFGRGTGTDRESFPATSREWFPVNEDGTFELTGIGSGTWAVELSWRRVRGRSSSRATLSVGEIVGLAEGERRKFELDLSDRVFAKVTGRILVGEKPYEGQVSFYKDGERSDSAMANEKGEFTAFVSPGLYRVRAQYRLFADESVSVAPGEEVTREFHVTVATIRVRVLGPDGEPRQGVRLLVVDKSSKRSVRLRPSGIDGHAERQFSPGSYDLMVMPKRLTEQDALRKFREENRNDPEATVKARVHLTAVEARIGAEDRIEVRLPAAAGY